MSNDNSNNEKISQRALKIGASEKHSEIAKVAIEVEETEGKIEGLEKKIEGLEKKIEGLEKKIEGLEQKIENLESISRNERQEKELERLYDVVKRLYDEKKQLRDEKNKLLDEKNKLLDEKKQLREKELILLRSSQAARDSVAVTAAFGDLSLGPRFLQIAWGRPKAASNFALSAQNWERLDLLFCLSPVGFWQPPSPHLAEDVGEIRRVFGALCGCESYSQTCLEKVSETKGESSVDAVMVERLRSVFCSSRFECTEREQQKTLEQLNCVYGPASKSSKPDFTVRVLGLVVLDGEFKNNVTAPIEQLPQAAATCCNAVLAQYGAGVELDDCRCDMVLSNGHLFQFAAVTLLPPCMAKLVVTSRVLDHSDHADALEISKRLAWLTAFCSRNRKLGVKREIPEAFSLDLHKYHEKPSGKWLRQDRSINGSERSYIRIFEKLWQCEELRSCVVFPEGFLRDKGAFRSIIFEKLDESWLIGLPTDDRVHGLFLQQFRHVVKLMHSCNVVHMDLMPCNIAWKEGQDGSVQIKLLDFDAATNLPFRIGDRLQELTLTNRREYMWSANLSPNVRFDCWYWFLYSKIPSQFRVFADVSGELSPDEVNGPFLDWLGQQNMSSLRLEFAAVPLLSAELNLNSW